MKQILQLLIISDLRAPTPSAAAELAVYDVNAFMEQLTGAKEQLTMLMDRRLRMLKMQTEQKKQFLNSLSPMAKVREKKYQCIRNEELLEDAFFKILDKKKHQLQLQIERLSGLSPLQKLQQGYSYVVGSEGKNVRSITQVNPEDMLEIYVTDGKIVTKVDSTTTLQY